MAENGSDDPNPPPPPNTNTLVAVDPDPDPDPDPGGNLVNSPRRLHRLHHDDRSAALVAVVENYLAAVVAYNRNGIALRPLENDDALSLLLSVLDAPSSSSSSLSSCDDGDPTMGGALVPLLLQFYWMMRRDMALEEEQCPPPGRPDPARPLPSPPPPMMSSGELRQLQKDMDRRLLMELVMTQFKTSSEPLIRRILDLRRPFLLLCNRRVPGTEADRLYRNRSEACLLRHRRTKTTTAAAAAAAAAAAMEEPQPQIPHEPRGPAVVNKSSSSIRPTNQQGLKGPPSRGDYSGAEGSRQRGWNEDASIDQIERIDRILKAMADLNSSSIPPPASRRRRSSRQHHDDDLWSPSGELGRRGHEAVDAPRRPINEQTSTTTTTTITTLKDRTQPRRSPIPAGAGAEECRRQAGKMLARSRSSNGHPDIGIVAAAANKDDDDEATPRIRTRTRALTPSRTVTNVDPLEILLKTLDTDMDPGSYDWSDPITRALLRTYWDVREEAFLAQLRSVCGMLHDDDDDDDDDEPRGRGRDDDRARPGGRQPSRVQRADDVPPSAPPETQEMERKMVLQLLEPFESDSDVLKGVISELRRWYCRLSRTDRLCMNRSLAYQRQMLMERDPHDDSVTSIRPLYQALGPRSAQESEDNFERRRQQNVSHNRAVRAIHLVAVATAFFDATRPSPNRHSSPQGEESDPVEEERTGGDVINTSNEAVEDPSTGNLTSIVLEPSGRSRSTPLRTESTKPRPPAQLKDPNDSKYNANNEDDVDPPHWEAVVSHSRHRPPSPCPDQWLSDHPSSPESVRRHLKPEASRPRSTDRRLKGGRRYAHRLDGMTPPAAAAKSVAAAQPSETLAWGVVPDASEASPERSPGDENRGGDNGSLGGGDATPGDWGSQGRGGTLKAAPFRSSGRRRRASRGNESNRAADRNILASRANRPPEPSPLNPVLKPPPGQPKDSRNDDDESEPDDESGVTGANVQGGIVQASETLVASPSDQHSQHVDNAQDFGAAAEEDAWQPPANGDGNSDDGRNADDGSDDDDSVVFVGVNRPHDETHVSDDDVAEPEVVILLDDDDETDEESVAEAQVVSDDSIDDGSDQDSEDDSSDEDYEDDSSELEVRDSGAEEDDETQASEAIVPANNNVADGNNVAADNNAAADNNMAADDNVPNVVIAAATMPADDLAIFEPNARRKGRWKAGMESHAVFLCNCEECRSRDPLFRAYVSCHESEHERLRPGFVEREMFEEYFPPVPKNNYERHLRRDRTRLRRAAEVLPDGGGDGVVDGNQNGDNVA